MRQRTRAFASGRDIKGASMRYILLLITFLITNNVLAQTINRTGTDTYQETIVRSESIKDTQSHCDKVQQEINDLQAEEASCQAKISDVKKQVDPNPPKDVNKKIINP